MAGPAHPGHPARDDALDALRGVAVAGMAVVNLQVPDQGYALLRHATWNGLTLADIVFPVFLLAVGLSTPLAIDRRGAALAGLLRRTALLFALGVALGWLLRPTLDPTAIRVAETGRAPGRESVCQCVESSGGAAPSTRKKNTKKS